MKQGVGFSVTINIIAVFIVVTFAFLVASLNYYKAYKVNNAITSSIEKFEGYNNLSKNEIATKLTSLGYVSGGVKCKNVANTVDENLNDTNLSYCIYKQQRNANTGKVKYKVVTFINFNIPIINQVLNLPVNTYTEPIYIFTEP